jgi:hypothetical protein
VTPVRLGFFNVGRSNLNVTKLKREKSWPEGEALKFKCLRDQKYATIPVDALGMIHLKHARQVHSVWSHLKIDAWTASLDFPVQEGRPLVTSVTKENSQMLPAVSARNALPVLFKIKIPIQVCFVKNVRRDGSRIGVDLHRALILEALNRKIAKVQSTLTPLLSSATRRHLVVVVIVQPVDRVLDPLM